MPCCTTCGHTQYEDDGSCPICGCPAHNLDGMDYDGEMDE